MIISNQIVMKSAAGYYIGTCYVCNEDFEGSEESASFDEEGNLLDGFPYSRDSDYMTKEEAEKYLIYIKKDEETV